MPSIADRIRQHLTDPQSHHRRIAISFLWVSLFVFIGRLAGAAKEMAIAWRYGVSETVDAYVFIVNLITWPVAVWFSVLTVVLVPLVAHVRHNNPVELPRFRGELLGLTLIIGLVLGVLATFGLPWLLTTGWIGFSDKTLTEARRMAGALALLAPIGTVISLFSAWMLACNRRRNTLMEALPALAILIALLLPPGWLPEPLLWGTVAGFALHLATLGAFLHRQGELQTPRLTFGSPAWQGFWGSIGIMATGQVLMSFTTIIDQVFAADLGPGALSTLSYANRILALILTMGATAISRATLPIFSATDAQGGNDVNALALRWAMWMFGLALLAIIAVWPMSHLIVDILFERGAFQSKDTAAVAQLLQYGLLQLPFYMAGLVLVSALSSKKKYAIIARIALINVMVKIVLNHYLITAFGLAGVAFATTIMYAFSTLLCFIAVTTSKKT